MPGKQPVWPAAEAWNVEPVGYHDLEQRPAFKIALHVVNDRWLLYLSHFWHSGWSVVDVTDPTQPEYLRFVPGPPDTFTLQVQAAEGLMIGGMEQIFPHSGWGGDPNKPFEEGVLIFDIATDPTNPQLLSHWKTGGIGTHRNFYNGGRYVHLSAAAPGFSGNLYRILDVADPRNPKEVGRWALAEQWEAAGQQPKTPNTFLHGPAYVEGDRAYISYSAAGLVILDVSDLTTPWLVSHLPLYPPFSRRFACHTAVPLPRRQLVVVNSEMVDYECIGPFNFTGMVDVSNEREPRLISIFPLPIPSEGQPFTSYCDKAGWFGPHNQSHPQGNPYVEQRDDRVYLTYFNAGLRIYDTSDARQPREIAYFVPQDPEERLGSLPLGDLVVQTEDVVVDTRGFIYLTDKNLGLQVVRCNV
jgi:hypothetical protein